MSARRAVQGPRRSGPGVGLPAGLMPVARVLADVECTVGKTRYVDTPFYALLRCDAVVLAVGELVAPLTGVFGSEPTS